LVAEAGVDPLEVLSEAAEFGGGDDGFGHGEPYAAGRVRVGAGGFASAVSGGGADGGRGTAPRGEKAPGGAGPRPARAPTWGVGFWGRVGRMEALGGAGWAGVGACADFAS